MSGSPGPRRAREPGTRETARRAYLLQLQHPTRSHERLRGELSVLFVRAAASGRSGLVHDVARGSVGQAPSAGAPATDGSPRRERPSPRPAVRLLPRTAAGIQTDPAWNSSEVLHGG